MAAAIAEHYDLAEDRDAAAAWYLEAGRQAAARHAHHEAVRLLRRALELTDAAKEVLAEAGWDPTYGARPLKRALQRLVENPLAQRLLTGEFSDDDTIRIDAQDGELAFESAARAAVAG